MILSFYKYQGTGNDFIIVDNRNLAWRPDTGTVAMLCNRRFGIGADGLMLLNNMKDFSFEMKYYNADGKLGSMCGNGGRCIVAFAKYLNIIDTEARFWASDGEHFAHVEEIGHNENFVKLQMKDVHLIEQKSEDIFYLETGSPHYVRFVDDLVDFDVFTQGKEIRYSKEYAKQNGTNVNFVKVETDSIFVRTYERGVEDETLSCGTGVTASALAFAKKSGQEEFIKIKTLGGILKVSFKKVDDQNFKDIFLEGPAKQVYKGEIELEITL